MIQIVSQPAHFNKIFLLLPLLLKLNKIFQNMDLWGRAHYETPGKRFCWITKHLTLLDNRELSFASQCIYEKKSWSS